MSRCRRTLLLCLSGLTLSHGLPLTILLAGGVAGCGQAEQSKTHYGRIHSLEFEHRNVVKYEGDGGPEVSLLVTTGGVKGAIPEGGIKLHYSVNGEPFQAVPMRHTVSGRRFVGQVPHQEKGSKVNYYIEVVHRNGRRLTFPAKADSGAYFTISIE